MEKRVVNEKGIPLAFSTVRILPGQNGTIANEDGFFILPLDLIERSDSLSISHLGYETQKISSTTIVRLPIITLKSSPSELSEVIISSRDEKEWLEFVFSAFEKQRSTTSVSKARAKLTLRSKRNETVVEFLEGKGAVSFDEKSSISEFYFNQVRALADPSNSFRFYSIHTRSVLIDFEPYSKSENSSWPLHPGKLTKKSLAKKYELIPLDRTGNITHLRLQSREPNLFDSEIWIRESDGRIIKYYLEGKNLNKFPLESIDKENEIRSVNSAIALEYDTETLQLQLIKWEYDFNYGPNEGRLESVVKLIVEDEQIKELPLFLADAEYHDYAMAAILPDPLIDENPNSFLKRSIKDQDALTELQKYANNLNSGFVFHSVARPLALSSLRFDPSILEEAYGSLAEQNNFANIGDLFDLRINSAIAFNEEGKWQYQTFIDTTNSIIAFEPSLEIGLMVNLILDEYYYSSLRIASAYSYENAMLSIKLEKDELKRKVQRILLNSKSGKDLSYLLEVNYQNFKDYGIDRFAQLKSKAFESSLFQTFESHLNPKNTTDLALAFLISGRYTEAINLTKQDKSSAAALYVSALANFYLGNCDTFKTKLNEAERSGFEIPDSAKQMCRD